MQKVDLSVKNVKDLKVIAQTLNIDVKGLKKAQIIELIENNGNIAKAEKSTEIQVFNVQNDAFIEKANVDELKNCTQDLIQQSKGFLKIKLTNKKTNKVFLFDFLVLNEYNDFEGKNAFTFFNNVITKALTMEQKFVGLSYFVMDIEKDGKKIANYIFPLKEFKTALAYQKSYITNEFRSSNGLVLDTFNDKRINKLAFDGVETDTIFGMIEMIANFNKIANNVKK